MKRTSRGSGVVLALAASVLLSLVHLPARAAFVMNGGTDMNLPVAANDYNSDLMGLGFDTMRTEGYLSVDQSGFIDFYFIGAESFYSDTFTVTEHPSSVTSSITDPWFNSDGWRTPFDFGGVTGYTPITIAVTAGERLDFQFSNSFDTANNLTGSRLLDLGIVYDPGAPTLSQLVLAYDDEFFLDNDHDDLLIRADFRPVPVPPAVWLFTSGLVGFATVARTNRRQDKRAQAGPCPCARPGVVVY
jgi:hypothetical protein